MKNIFPSMSVIMILLITAVVSSLLLVDFPDVISFLLYVGKILGIWITCYCIGYGGAWGVSITIGKIKDRHKRRFMWYHRMGLLESSVLVEPKYAKKYWTGRWWEHV